MEQPNFSLSDLAAVAKDNNGGASWNNPMWLLWAILFGGGNFGGFGGFNRGQGLQDSEIMAQLNSLREQIAANQNANILNGAVKDNGNALNTLLGAVNLGFAGTGANINQSSMASMMAMKDALYQIATSECDIKSTILSQTNQLSALIAQVANQTQAGMTNLGFAIANQTNELNTNANANTQRILDQLCADKIEAKNDQIAQLRQQLSMADLRASQTAQNAFISQGFANEVDALYNRLNSCPVPTTPVYGRTPIFTCNQNSGCGCGCGSF
jgi:hypothetical protein